MTPDALDRLRKLADESVNGLRPFAHYPDCDLGSSSGMCGCYQRRLDDAANVILSLLDALDAREADAKDAARYRWLSHPENVDEAEPILKLWGKSMSEAIDAALRGGEGKAG